MSIPQNLYKELKHSHKRPKEKLKILFNIFEKDKSLDKKYRRLTKSQFDTLLQLAIQELDQETFPGSQYNQFEYAPKRTKTHEQIRFEYKQTDGDYYKKILATSNDILSGFDKENAFWFIGTDEDEDHENSEIIEGLFSIFYSESIILIEDKTYEIKHTVHKVKNTYQISLLRVYKMMMNNYWASDIAREVLPWTHAFKSVSGSDIEDIRKIINKVLQIINVSLNNLTESLKDEGIIEEDAKPNWNFRKDISGKPKSQRFLNLLVGK